MRPVDQLDRETAAGGFEIDDVTASVGRISGTADQVVALEVVEVADEMAAVEA